MADLRTTIHIDGDARGALGAIGSLTKGIGGVVDALGKVGLAAMGLQAIASGARSAGQALGIGLVSELEQTRAQFLAFTKDAALTDRLLEDVRKEAARTPFAFRELAQATASLIPAAKQARVPLEDLRATAEILAASNPAQGLEGAAFALREAVSGDFTSIIERFNLPRQRINQLKEEGVPALQAVQRAMQEMGYDAGLVANMATTMSGRWSTFMDTIDSLKVTLATPLFEVLSRNLVMLQGILDANMPVLEAWAKAVGQTLAGGLQTAINRVVTFIGALRGDWAGQTSADIDEVTKFIGSLGTAIHDLATTGDWSTLTTLITTNVQAWAQALVGWIEPQLEPMKERLRALITDFTNWAGSKQVLDLIEAAAASWTTALLTFLGNTADGFRTGLIGATDDWERVSGEPGVEERLARVGARIGAAIARGIGTALNQAISDWLMQRREDLRIPAFEPSRSPWSSPVAPPTRGRGAVLDPGFQHGGAFYVGGAGGPDSQFVGFRATPGELVTVTPRGAGAGMQVTININGTVRDDGDLARIAAAVEARLSEAWAGAVGRGTRAPVGLAREAG